MGAVGQLCPLLQATSLTGEKLCLRVSNIKITAFAFEGEFFLLTWQTHGSWGCLYKGGDGWRNVEMEVNHTHFELAWSSLRTGHWGPPWPGRLLVSPDSGCCQGL